MLSSINEYKLKIMDLETSLSNLTQQLKISTKEKEYSVENLKRELNMVKEDNNDLQTKNRKLNEQIDESNWVIREGKLLQAEEIINRNQGP